MLKNDDEKGETPTRRFSSMMRRSSFGVAARISPRINEGDNEEDAAGSFSSY